MPGTLCEPRHSVARFHKGWIREGSTALATVEMVVSLISGTVVGRTARMMSERYSLRSRSENSCGIIRDETLKQSTLSRPSVAISRSSSVLRSTSSVMCWNSSDAVASRAASWKASAVCRILSRRLCLTSNFAR